MHSLIDPLNPLLRRVRASAAVRPAPSPNAKARLCRHTLRAGEGIALQASDAAVQLVLPLDAGLSVEAARERHALQPGQALLAARPEQFVCRSAEGGAMLVFQAPRTAIQAEASCVLSTPRRLALATIVFAWPILPAALRGGSAAQGAIAAQERQVLRAMVRAMVEAGVDDTAFPIARSVLCAMAPIRTDPRRAWTVEDLAPAAGVTAATLRRNFRNCLGMSVGQVVREARLVWVRERLRSLEETRSIAQLAMAAGFTAPRLLTRSYQHHFGETPSETRAWAFGIGAK